MAYRTHHDPIWNHPSRRRLFLLVAFVVGTLTVVSIFLILKSRDLEQMPEAPLMHPMVHLALPQNPAALPSSR